MLALLGGCRIDAGRCGVVAVGARAAAMKHAIIFGHPNADSFTASVARAYSDSVSACGDDAVVRDLYRLGFDPRLQAGEIPSPGFAAEPDVAAERAALANVDVFTFVYPLWFNAPPAIVLGYMQRVFGLGFGFAAGLTGNRPLLTKGKMVSFTSSGAPTEWLQKEGGWDAMRTLFDEHFAAVCGLDVVAHQHFGHIVPSTPQPVIATCLAQVAAIARRSRETPP